MKRGLFAVMALLTIFAMIGCDNGSGPGPGPDNNITISFDLDGGPGTKPSSVTIPKNTALGNKLPSIEGNGTKEFLGWFNGTNQVTKDTTLSTSVTLKAKWKDLGEIPEGKFRIIFNLGGASGEPPDFVDIDATAEIAANDIPEDPEWTGYAFDGWFNGTTQLTVGYKKPANFTENYIVFTAKWTASGLKPWAPPVADQPVMPTSGYKDYYKDIAFEDWTYTTFAGTGNVGSIEDNGDGTYNVTIKTNPGGVSLLAFVNQDYTFKNGYYVSFNFPEDTDAKPIMALTGAATGSRNDDGLDWQSLYNVNRNPDIQGYVPINDDVYLAGDIAFARDDLNTLYKSIVLTLVWSADEETEYYEFTLKKLLITTGEDLTPPEVDTMTPWPHEVAEPTDWIAFPPSTETLNATFYPWDEGNKIEGNTVTVISSAGGRSLVRLYGDEFKYQKGFYLSVNLPNNSVKPQKIYALGINSPTHDGDWTASTLVDPEDITKFVAGKVDFTWASDTNTTAYTGVILDIYWYAGQTDALYTFTVNKILVAEEAGTITPPEGPEPKLTKLKTYLSSASSGWGTTTTWNSNYEQDPFAGNFTGTATVTGPNDGPFVIAGVEGGTDNVTYLIIKLTFNADAVGKTYECTLSDLAVSDASDNSLLSVGTLPAGVVETSTPGTYTITVTAAAESMIALPISSGTAQAASFNYKLVLPSVFPEPKLTKLKTYLASSEWGFGTTTTWNSNYEEDPFDGNFTGTATVTGPNNGPFVIAGFDGGSDNVKYLVINLSFNADAVGKKYECTLSDLAVSDASDNSLLSVGTLPTGVVETSTPGTYTITVTAAATSQIILPVTAGTTQAASFNYKMVLPSTFK